MQNLLFDTYGHVIGFTTKTISTGGGGVTQQYVDDQDLYFFSLSKNYTDSKINNVGINNNTLWHNDECLNAVCDTYLQVSEI